MRQTAITYGDGRPVSLGDVIDISVGADEFRRARVVMIGDTREHLDIDRSFLDWVQRDMVIQPSQVVVEWVGDNPFAHNDPNYEPVGNYMFTTIDSCVVRLET